MKLKELTENTENFLKKLNDILATGENRYQIEYHLALAMSSSIQISFV